MCKNCLNNWFTYVYSDVFYVLIQVMIYVKRLYYSFNVICLSSQGLYVCMNVCIIIIHIYVSVNVYFEFVKAPIYEIVYELTSVHNLVNCLKTRLEYALYIIHKSEYLFLFACLLDKMCDCD